MATTSPKPSKASLSDIEQPSNAISPSPERQELPSEGETNIPPLEEEKTVFKPSKGFLLAFGSICIVTLAAALDATSLSIALPIVTVALNGTAIEAFWAGTSFLVASAVFMPVIGGLSHVFGRKQLILASSLFFAVGSLVAALANGFGMMLVGRTIQGIGGGGILTLGEILVTDLVPLSVRGAWFGYLGSMWAIGSVSGPLVGGAFAQNVSWRWIFYINLPIIGAGTILVIIFLKLEKLPGKVLEKAKHFDWFGSTLFVAATLSFMIPLTWGGVMYPWSHWRTLFPLLFGAAGLVAFGFYQYWLSKRAFGPESIADGKQRVEPIIRFTIFSNITLIITYFETLIHGMVLWSLLYYLPLYYEGVKGYTPIITGVAVLPESSFVAPMSIIVGVVCSITGRYRWAIWAGWFLTTLGAGILILLDVETTIVQWVFINITVSIGTGMLFPAMALAIQAAGRQEDAAHSVAFYAFFRVFGQAIGVAVGGVAFQNAIRTELLSIPLLADMAGEYSRDATSLVLIIHQMEHGLRRDLLVQAYADALKTIWIVMTALSGAAMLASAFTGKYSLQQEMKTKQGYQGDKKVGDVEKVVQ